MGRILSTFYKSITFVFTNRLAPISFIRKMSDRTTRATLQWQEEKEKFLNMAIQEKRKVYACKKYNELKDVQSWKAYFLQQKSRNEIVKVSVDKANEKKNTKPNLCKKVSIFKGDITSLEIDAIVNAANEALLGGGGVDGAIHRASGPMLKKECACIEKDEYGDRCATGEAKITGGYKLPSKYVIHTVGPRGENKEKLRECYLNSLIRLKENDLKSIAFPCISTGVFGYPNKNAADVALTTIYDWLQEEDNMDYVERIILCLFLEKDIRIYEEKMQLFFPVDEQSRDDEITQEQSGENEEETNDTNINSVASDGESTGKVGGQDKIEDSLQNSKKNDDSQEEKNSEKNNTCKDDVQAQPNSSQEPSAESKQTAV